MRQTLIAALLTLAVVANAQQRLPEYLQAEKFTQEKLSNMLFSTKIDPHWFPSGDKFWYEYKTGEGVFWYVVSPSSRNQVQLFDREDIASQLTEIVQDPFEARHLPISNLKLKDDCRTFTFEVVSSRDKKKDKDDKPKAGPGEKPKGPKGGKPKQTKEVFYFEYDYTSQTLTHLKDMEEEPERKRWASFSPDGKTVVFAKDCNLYRMSIDDYRKAQKDEKDSTIVEVQITRDGMPDFGYGIPRTMMNTDTLCDGSRREVRGCWSPDSKHFLTVVTDNRHVKSLWVINSLAEPRPTLETYKYQMPGEMDAPEYHLMLFDMTDNSCKEVNAAAWKHQGVMPQMRQHEQRQRDAELRSDVWQGDNDRFFLVRSSRDLHRIDLCTYTIGDDSVKTVVEERMNTYQETKPVFTLRGGKEFVWWSERDGWAHLYLYDINGNLKNRITRGSWHVDKVVKVDEATGTVFFTASGREQGENPYYMHLYRVNSDGSGLKRLTEGEFFHEVQMDDDCKYFVDNYSRVNTVPTADLLSTAGQKIMKVQTSDFSRLLEAGYKFPETFVVKAADGVTDLYGVMYKPFDFDSTKVYPIIDYVYPGPQVEATYYPFTLMSVRTDRLAQAGFIVVSVGQRGGHPNRSKWYHNYGYGNMRDYPLADHKAAVEQLAARHPYIDIDRVGMHGHSGGGFMTVAALCKYPDFYKAGVSCAGNHDNRIYNRWWSETHHGVKEEVSEKGDTTFVYKIGTNPEIVKSLKCPLLLVHGDVDDNVHPGNTLRVVNALIREGKRFDMLILPGQKHGFGDMNEYFYWRLVDFFSEHLKGRRETSVDIPKR